jgi:Zn-dependent peptidase ImmA (M78 family)
MRQTFREIDNIYSYDRESLIEEFAIIRQYTQDVTNGFINVARRLYKTGVTIIVRESFKKSYIRGVTMSVNGKPCIGLTTFNKDYAAMWVTLLHELHHVLFDWEEINAKGSLISYGDLDKIDIDLPPYYSQQEKQANEFAYNYLLDKEELQELKYNIEDIKYVEDLASDNDLEPSIIYFVYAESTRRDFDYARAKKFSPPFRKMNLPEYEPNFLI